jgi:hypothetical protein
MFLEDSHTDPTDTPQGSPGEKEFKPTLLGWMGVGGGLKKGGNAPRATVGFAKKKDMVQI